MSITLKNNRVVPRNSVFEREKVQNNGTFCPLRSVYVISGTSDAIPGSTTGSITINFDTFAFSFARIEVFHSGAASFFDLTFENKTNNTGTNFDPTACVADYKKIAGSNNYTGGMDQVESLIGLTDVSGSLYMKLKPYDTGDNWFKYLIFFEEVALYVRKDLTY